MPARGLTFGAPLYVTFLLKDEKGTKEEKVFMGEIPLMTPRAPFVINGAERVIVSQLHRSPGLAFETTQHPNGKLSTASASSPDRGSGTKPSSIRATCCTSISTGKRRRKFLTTTFFRALYAIPEARLHPKPDSKIVPEDVGKDGEILDLYRIEELSLKGGGKAG